MMQIIAGVLGLTAMAGCLVLVAAAWDDRWARRVSAILLARAEAREAYRKRYADVLRERENEFGLKQSQVTES